jgi:hypothetical protein
MSNVGDALSGGGSSASGVNDQTFADATLGDQMQGGTGDFTGGDAGGGPTEFNQFSDVANALSSGTPAGASPTVAQSAAMNPPGAVAQTGGDPVGAASGTQSSTDPGSSPTGQNQPQQTGQSKNQPDQNQYAPKSATDQLRALLKQLSGKPTGPTGPTVPAAPSAPFALPTLARGQTGPQSPRMPLPNVDAGETGAQSPGSFYGTPLQPSGGSPVSQVAGAPAADARIAPNAATQPSAAVSPPSAAPAAGGGRDITVRKAAPQAMPFPQNEPGEVAPGGPALPTRKPTQPPQAPPQPEPAASEPTETEEGPAPAAPRLLQDISGASLGSPTALRDLAQAAQIILPLIGMFMGGGGRRGGHRGGFQGMRGFRPFGAPGGFRGGHPGAFGHPSWRGSWPYHHPMHGWDMHHQHPGGGWLPLNPAELQGLGGGQQGGQPGAQDPNAPDPDRPPKETGATVGPPDQVGTSGAIPGVGAKEVDDYTRQVAQKYNIDPNVASKILSIESSYGQAKKPGDNGTSFGPFQLHFAPDGQAMGDQFRRDTGLDPRDPRTWKAQIDYAMKKAADPKGKGWLPWQTTMKKLGMNQWSGINRQFAGQPMSKTIDPKRDIPAYSVGNASLPPSSRPMVAGP